MKPFTIITFIILQILSTLIILSITSDGLSKQLDNAIINDLDLKLAVKNQLSRDKIIQHLGQPIHSDLGIKFFDIYKYQLGNKSYTMNINYQQQGDEFFIKSYEIYKHNPRIIISHYVILH